jgi:hypothetical protein
VIRPLRRRHRQVWGALAVVLPAVYVAALAARPAPPRLDPLPPALVSGVPEGAAELGVRDNLWRGAVLRTRLLALPGGGLAVELAASAVPAVPTPLVYWSSGAEAASAGETAERPGEAPGLCAHEGLPAEATLLGPLGFGGPTVLPLPEAARTGAGRLLLWSFGHGRVVAWAELPASGAAGGD